MVSNKISIIMGIYNCSNTLSEAIDSIVNQTYDDWELIMCDDGSLDNTYEIAKSYQEKFPKKIILLKNKHNVGLNQTLNNCLAKATGEYIARMDGDDLSDPTRLDKEITFLQNNPQYSIVSTPMKYFDETGVFREDFGGGEPDVNKIPMGTPFCHAPCMVRKEAYDAVGGYTVDKKLLRVEDWHLWIKMYSKGYKGFVLNEPLYLMRDDRNAYSRRKFIFRLNEARVSVFATKELHLSKIHYFCCLRPIIVGLLPKPIYMFLHKQKIS